MVETLEIKKSIAAFLKKPIEKVPDEARLTDLVHESFVLVELVIELQESFGVSFGQEELKAVQSVGDLVALVRSRARR